MGKTTNTTKEHSVYISCANTLYTVHLIHPGKHLPYSQELLYIMQGFLSNVYHIGDVAFLFYQSSRIMKTRIDVIASKESYCNLSTFEEVEELNKTVRTYRDTIYMSIKRTDIQSKLIALLEILKLHSCKYVGVSFLCKNRIATKMEVSYKTMQRLMKKLVDLQMIKQVAMKRTKDMLQTLKICYIISCLSYTKNLRKHILI